MLQIPTFESLIQGSRIKSNTEKGLCQDGKSYWTRCRKKMEFYFFLWILHMKPSKVSSMFFSKHLVTLRKVLLSPPYSITKWYCSPILPFISWGVKSVTCRHSNSNNNLLFGISIENFAFKILTIRSTLCSLNRKFPAKQFNLKNSRSQIILTFFYNQIF